MTAIGEMKRRVTFQQAVLVPDGAGGFAQTWQAIAEEPEVFAAVTALAGTEQLAFGQLQSAVTHKIYVRWRGDITPAMRIIEGSTVYNIISVLDREGTRVRLEIGCVARVP